MISKLRSTFIGLIATMAVSAQARTFTTIECKNPAPDGHQVNSLLVQLDCQTSSGAEERCSYSVHVAQSNRRIQGALSYLMGPLGYINVPLLTEKEEDAHLFMMASGASYDSALGGATKFELFPKEKFSSDIILKVTQNTGSGVEVRDWIFRNCSFN